MVRSSRVRARLGYLAAVFGLAFAGHTQGIGPDDLLPRLERQHREARQALRLDQQHSTRRGDDVRNARERFQQGILHEQQRRSALVSRRSPTHATNRSSIRTSNNTRLQQFRRQQNSQLLRFKITR